jgi:RNA recognition motif-containing protein
VLVEAFVLCQSQSTMAEETQNHNNDIRTQETEHTSTSPPSLLGSSLPAVISSDSKSVDYPADAATYNLFVGDLHKSATEEELREAFQSFGTIHSASILKDKFSGQPRGCGFVNFFDPLALDRALQQPIYIRDKLTKNSKSEKRDTLYINHVDLNKYNERNGNLSELKAKLDALTGVEMKLIGVREDSVVAQYANYSASVKAYQSLKDLLFEGTRLRVYPASDKRFEEQTTLFVRGISPSTTEKTLLDLLSKYGKISKLNIVRDHESGASKQYAFLTMETQAECSALIKAADGSIVDGAAIGLKFADKGVNKASRTGAERGGFEGERGRGRGGRGRGGYEDRTGSRGGGRGRERERGGRRGDYYDRDYQDQRYDERYSNYPPHPSRYPPYDYYNPYPSYQSAYPPANAANAYPPYSQDPFAAAPADPYASYYAAYYNQSASADPYPADTNSAAAASYPPHANSYPPSYPPIDHNNPAAAYAAPKRSRYPEQNNSVSKPTRYAGGAEEDRRKQRRFE